MNHPAAVAVRTPAARRHEVGARFFAVVTDLVGTPTELVSPHGETAPRSRSTCWGTTGWNTSATACTPLRFPGQYAGPETGLRYNYFRYYAPGTARFTSTDPWGSRRRPIPPPTSSARGCGRVPSARAEALQDGRHDGDGSIR
ncbi:RHS repeat-associated core domain-containing protein [Streptomyces sp. NPDC058092]|uniref:RHS repeat-associated core domain-containing protein n=1 Tax=Streptomyces sp. NPDC058092 TaxID=3346336 RepID=UPI0036EC9053